MHPTRDTTDFIYLNFVGGRVMPGVGLQCCVGTLWRKND
jgi:hypothetical protein